MKQAKSEELASKAGKDDINEENEIVVGKLAEVSRAENLKDLLLGNLRFTDDIRKFKCTKNILFLTKIQQQNTFFYPLIMLLKLRNRNCRNAVSHLWPDTTAPFLIPYRYAVYSTLIMEMHCETGCFKYKYYKL